MNELTNYREKGTIISEGLSTLGDIATELFGHFDQWLPNILKDNDSRRFHRSFQHAIDAGYDVELIYNSNKLSAVRRSSVQPAYIKEPKI